MPRELVQQRQNGLQYQIRKTAVDELVYSRYSYLIICPNRSVLQVKWWKKALEKKHCTRSTNNSISADMQANVAENRKRAIWSQHTGYKDRMLVQTQVRLL